MLLLIAEWTICLVHMLGFRQDGTRLLIYGGFKDLVQRKKFYCLLDCGLASGWDEPLSWCLGYLWYAHPRISLSWFSSAAPGYAHSVSITFTRGRSSFEISTATLSFFCCAERVGPPSKVHWLCMWNLPGHKTYWECQYWESSYFSCNIFLASWNYCLWMVKEIRDNSIVCESHSVVSDPLRPHGLYRPWNSLAQNTGVGSPSLLQVIFPTQGSNPGLPHCSQILYQQSHKGSQRILEWVAYPFSRGSSWPRNWTGVSCIAGRFFTNWATREALGWWRSL